MSVGRSQIAGASVRPLSQLRGARGEFGLVSAVIVATILACLSLQFHLVFVQEVNWDEFFFLSFIHDHQRGVLQGALQTIHVHLFGWLPRIGSNEIEQITAARLVMFAMEVGTAGLLFGIARTFVSRQAALFATLTYLSTADVFLHGASFRADPIAAFFMMTSLFLLVRSRLGLAQLVAIAACAALAELITVKAFFYAPAFAGAALWRLSREGWSRGLLLKLCFTGAGAVLLFAALYFLHLSGLPQASMSGSVDSMSGAYRKTFLWRDLFPRADFLVISAVFALIQTLLLAAGFLAVARRLRRGEEKAASVAVLLLAAPLLSFVFYRNAYPYFVAFIVPPAMVLAGVAFERLANRRLLLLALPLIMFVPTALVHGRTLTKERTAQEEMVAVVHQLFPQPVPYIDRCAMISSFPKKGFFMSSWGLENYRARGAPIFETILSRSQPVFVIANSPALEDGLEGVATDPAEQGLLAEDAALLRANYVHHWGALWLAGKALVAGPAVRSFEILIPGRYTVESETAVLVDGRTYAPNAVVSLQAGTHKIAADRPSAVTLRWGENLRRPARPPSSSPIFWGF